MITRRLFAVAVAGALVVAGLAGCRSNPRVAAYVGNERITEAEVDAMMADLPEKVKQHNDARQQNPQQFEAVMPSREDVVSTMVFAEVCQRTEGGGQPSQELKAEDLAEGERLPVGSQYLTARVGYWGCIERLAGQAEQVTPTEEQLREVYNRGRAAGAFQPEQRFEELAEQLAANQQLRAAYGARQTLATAVEAQDVTVNPRYRPLELPLLRFTSEHPAVVVPLSPVDAGPAVRDS